MQETCRSDVTKREMTEKYFDTVYRLALSQTRSSDRADDILQEVFLRYLKTDKEFESEEHIKAWLIRVTINCCRKMFASSWFKKTVPLSEDIAFESPEAGELYKVVGRLPQKYRAVIHLYYYEELSVAEIAQCLDMNENTVKSHLSRARAKLREMLKGGHEYEF